ncbi:MAG: MFS transporter [Candidatus Hydrogenedentes bacterium]|nr:MFS transporter [Candidatus Hydrogenedentota bacterium]
MPSHSANTWMLFRFSLYGFLKNQQYYEPFFILALQEKGLSFFQIGLLIAIRSVCTNVMELPSGAAADSYGRRLCMGVCFSGYILSFLVFGAGATFWHMALAMALFAIGEAFRTGTHKAMIFDWLRAQGRESERTRIYGYTRSWSKLGSALSAIVAAGLVLTLHHYSYVFWLCVIPYALNMINVLTYPAAVECTRPATGEGGALSTLMHALREGWHNRKQRRLFLESMGFEGMFEIGKDYLQPVLKSAALSLPVLLYLEDKQRTAILVGIVYTVLFLLASAASRQSHRVAAHYGGDEDRAARLLWRVAFLSYLLLIPSLFWNWHVSSIVFFVVLYAIQNLWRPALMARLDECSDASTGATTLSIESQAQSLFTMAGAPLLGYCVDRAGLWPVGVLGAALALLALLSRRRLSSARP